ncbi:helix-hairpin-helix domain-containing protein [Virgibacillus flavescens]|uniref:helix-hairpin-helix domain-containing protein n=1 Tax=Virgibacillus flavescens TaxID=1611422 RepID=UPI003D32AEBE
MVNLLKKNLFFIIIGLAAVLFLFIFNEKSKGDDTVEVNPLKQALPIQQEETQSPINMFVDVKGEVRNPGVYTIKKDSRVEDVINLAGGFTKQADQTVVNLAQKVHDEMIIAVPKAGETRESATGNTTKINLNYASQEEIEQLNGIGPSKAQAIIQYREETGLFQKIEDVLNVPGIGEKTLENMKENIQIP